MFRDKINILFFSHFPDAKMGGQKSMLALIRGLNRERFAPFCVVPSEGGLSRELEKAACPYFQVEIPSYKPKNILRILRAKKEIRKIIEKNNIRVLHPDNEKDALLAAYAKKKTAAKLLWHVRLTGKNHLDRFIAGKCDMIIGISEPVEKRFDKKDVDGKYRTVYNGTDTELFSPVDDTDRIRNKLGLAVEKKYVLFAGQMKIEKGIFDLLEAARLTEGSDIVYLLAGDFADENLKEDFYREIRDIGVDKKISHIGQKPDIYEWMQAADILVLPSYEGSEGMGRVLFEAMACGKPVIGTDISGVREGVGVSGEAGMLVPKRSPGEIAKAVHDILNGNYGTFAANARKRALEFFDIRGHVKKIESLYEELVK